MITSINDWMCFLRDVNHVGGVPLVAVGLALMLFGWRMWKICVVLAFWLIGAIGVSKLVGPGQSQLFYAACGGAVLGLAAFYPVKYAISLLGGLLVSGVVFHYLSGINIEGSTLWMSAGAALIGGTAFAALNRRHVVILVTAFLGAVLLMSGITAWIMAFPPFFGTVRTLASDSMIVVPFLLLVPTVMSCFYQVAEVHRLQIEL